MPLMGIEEQAALERQKQDTRNDFLDDGVRTVREQFATFLPDGVEKIRIIPGEEAENIREWATLAAREVRYAEQRISRYARDHRLTQVYVRDREKRRTTALDDVGQELYPYILADREGYIYYYRDRSGNFCKLPDYLATDIRPITDEIAGRLAMMSATKNEEMIANTLERPGQVTYPSYPVAPRAVPLVQEDELR